MASVTVQLHRYDTSQPWGFKMQGGADVDRPLYVAHVSPNGISGHAGLRPGDEIEYIGPTCVRGFTHEQARGEMIRAGNDIDLGVTRSGEVTSNPPDLDVEEEAPRMSVSGDGEEGFREVQSKSYQKMETDMDHSAASGDRPASIFDKKRHKRSEYTKAGESGYLKPYGQTD